jgi:uncharacterized protein with HEPN domain
MQPDDRVRIRHMVEAAETVRSFIADRERSDFDNDRMLLFALVRAIEATYRAPAEPRPTANVPLPGFSLRRRSF